MVRSLIIDQFIFIITSFSPNDDHRVSLYSFYVPFACLYLGSEKRNTQHTLKKGEEQEVRPKCAWLDEEYFCFIFQCVSQFIELFFLIGNARWGAPNHQFLSRLGHFRCLGIFTVVEIRSDLTLIFPLNFYVRIKAKLLKL